MRSRGYESVWNLGEIDVKERVDEKSGVTIKAHKKGYAGTAVFSKFKIEKSWKGFLQDQHVDIEGRVTTILSGCFVWVCIYLPMSGLDNDPNALRRKYRKSFDESLFIHCVKLQRMFPNKKVVLTGDLNVAHKPQDKWDSILSTDAHRHPSFRPDERRRFGRLLKDAELVDVFRHFQKNNTWSHYTFYFTLS